MADHFNSFQSSTGFEPLHLAVTPAFSPTLWHSDTSFPSSSSIFPSSNRNDASILRPTTPSSGTPSASSSRTSSPSSTPALLGARGDHSQSTPEWQVDGDGDVIMGDGTSFHSDPATSIPTATKLTIKIPPPPSISATASLPPSLPRDSASPPKKRLVRLPNGKAGFARVTDKV